MIDNCLGVATIGLGITGVGLLSTIVAAPAVIGMEAVSIFMCLLRVVGNQAIKKMSLKIDEIQEILIAERDKRNELSTNYNRGVNIIGVIDNCLGVTVIGFGITGVCLLSTIVAAPAVIEMEAV